MQQTHSKLHFVGIDQNRDLDFRGRDRLNIDATVSQRLEHGRRNACVAAHPHAHHRNLGDLGVSRQLAVTDACARIFEQCAGAVEVSLRHGEGHVGIGVFAADILDNHVDVDVGSRQGPEDRGNSAGAVGHSGQDNLGFVLVGGDAGDQLAFHVQSFQFFVRDNHRTRQRIRRRRIFVDKGREHLHPHLFLHSKAHRARLQHLGANAGQFQHLFIGHVLELAGLGHDARVGGIDAIDIGIDIATVRLEPGRHRHRAGVRATTAQRRDPAIIAHALKSGDHRDLAARHAGQHRIGINLADTRLGVRIVGVDRQLPTQPRTRLLAHRLQRQRQQTRRHLLASGHHHVILGRVIQRIGLAAEVDQTIRLASHRRDDHRHLMPCLTLARDDTGDAPDALGAGHRRAAEFHHDPGHGCSLPPLDIKYHAKPLAARQARALGRLYEQCNKEHGCAPSHAHRDALRDHPPRRGGPFR